jgi:hypothetical protein
MFLEAAMRSLHTYESLVAEGYRRSDAVLVLPQALRLYVARLYNGFNLLHPSGFLATRTCSYAPVGGTWNSLQNHVRITEESSLNLPCCGGEVPTPRLLP